MRGIFQGLFVHEERIYDNEATTIVINDNRYDAELIIDRLVTRTGMIVFQ